MKKLLLMIILMSSIHAELVAPKTGCILAQEGAVTVHWKAYKTPAKLGVGGIFDDVTYRPAKKEGKNFKEILVGAVVQIDTNSVNSKNEGRDAKLVYSFFKMMNGESLTAKIIDMTSNKRVSKKPRTGTITLEVTMNSVTKQVPLIYSYNKGVMKAKGVIDIFDFSASTALSSLNKACFDKHQGKTWSDVDVGFEMHIKAILCASK
jgi:hypothetical protein